MNLLMMIGLTMVAYGWFVGDAIRKHEEHKLRPSVNISLVVGLIFVLVGFIFKLD